MTDDHYDLAAFRKELAQIEDAMIVAGYPRWQQAVGFHADTWPRRDILGITDGLTKYTDRSS